MTPCHCRLTHLRHLTHLRNPINHSYSSRCITVKTSASLIGDTLVIQKEETGKEIGSLIMVTNSGGQIGITSMISREISDTKTIIMMIVDLMVIHVGILPTTDQTVPHGRGCMNSMVVIEIPDIETILTGTIMIQNDEDQMSSALKVITREAVTNRTSEGCLTTELVWATMGRDLRTTTGLSTQTSLVNTKHFLLGQIPGHPHYRSHPMIPCHHLITGHWNRKVPQTITGISEKHEKHVA